MASGPGASYRNHLSHTIPPFQPTSVAKFCAQCGAKFGIFKHQHHCRNCGNVVCFSCSEQLHEIPKFGYFNPVRCCDTCDELITMQKMDTVELSNLPIKKLRKFITAYNLPSQNVIEKEDLVRVIVLSNPISDAGEIFYRNNRNLALPRRSNDDPRLSSAPLPTPPPQNGTRRRGLSFGHGDRPTARTRTNGMPENGSTNHPQSGFYNQPPPQQRPSPSSYSYSGSSLPSDARPQSYAAPQRPQQQRYYSPPQGTPPPQHQPPPYGSYPPQQNSGYAYPQNRPQSPPPQNPNHLSPQHPRPTPRASSSSPHPTSTASTASTASTSTSTSHTSSLNPPPSLATLISARVDPATLSVKTLKAILRDQFVEHSNILEKSELVTRVSRLIEDKRNEMKIDTDTLSDEQLCKICCDAPQNCVFLECGHLTCCMDCGKKLVEKKNECPICREPIIKMLHVFRS